MLLNMPQRCNRSFCHLHPFQGRESVFHGPFLLEQFHEASRDRSISEPLLYNMACTGMASKE